jgi:hypothetical protein
MAWIERTSHYNRYISLSAMQTTILLINIDLQEGPLGAVRALANNFYVM